MRWMRYKACEKDADFMALHEALVPSCDSIGTLSNNRSYLAMPYAGPTMIRHYDSKKYPAERAALNPSAEDQQAMFAQIVAALHAMHNISVWHTDLNSGNLILDGTHLSLIDFGLITTGKCMADRCLDGYSRDAHGLFRWMSILADCPKEGRWTGRWWKRTPIDKLEQAQKAAEQCIKQRWNVDNQFLNALNVLFEANLRKDQDQHIWAVYNTDFVKKNMPKWPPVYRLPNMQKCWEWTPEKLQQEMDKMEATMPWDDYEVEKYDKVTISDADISAFNGVYETAGLLNNHTKYKNANGAIIYFDDDKWKVNKEDNTDEFVYYMEAPSTRKLPPSGKWSSKNGETCQVQAEDDDETDDDE
jgi:serine/threonine protein kinase